MTIGERLTTARHETNMTQEQVAEKIMVSRQTISNWENMKSLPDVISLIRLSDLYSINLDELLKGDPKMIKKIEEDTNVVKSNKRLITIAIVTILFAVMLRGVNYFITNPFLEFTSAAIPWILIGIGVACAMAYKNIKGAE